MNLQYEGPPISQRLKHSAYINDRLPRVALMMDSSRLKIGKHSLPNKLRCLRKVIFKWTDAIDKNHLRINLKTTFITGEWQYPLIYCYISDAYYIPSFNACDSNFFVFLHFYTTRYLYNLYHLWIWPVPLPPKHNVWGPTLLKRCKL